MPLGTIKKRFDNTGVRGNTIAETLIQTNAQSVDLQAIETLINQIRLSILYSAYDNPGLVISTNFDVKNGNALTYSINGLLKTLSANTNFDTGTAATIATTKWAVAHLSHDGTTPTVTWGTNSGAGYASEALAKAAMPAVAAGFAPVGYITVQAAGSTWTAGTDALQGGTGGTPATTTNYYNDPSLNGTYLGAAVSLTASKIGNGAGTAITA